MSKKIAYIRKGSVPIANQRVGEMFQKHFPEFGVDVIDVVDLIKARKDLLLANILHVVKEYGPGVLTNKAKLRHYFFTTPYIFNQIKNLVQKQVRQDNYLFSFQIQSLFDASVDDLPHFVYTDHTALANLSYSTFNRNHLNKQNWIELEKTIYQNALINFTRSTNISRSLIDQYDCNPNRVRCVYAGSNADVSRIQVNQAKYGYKNILFVGIDWTRKGGPELIEAFKIAQKSHPDAQLTIVGHSPKVDIPNCHIIGRVPITEINQYYQNSSIFCMPTKLEPFGIVFIEAMMHKLPIIATNIGAIPDFIKNGHNGYLVEPENVEQLAQALVDLLNQPAKCQAFGERGYQIATERYTWNNVGTRLKEHIMAAMYVRSYV